MAIYTNQATLRYNNRVTTSNIAQGEILEVLTVSKNVIRDSYTAGDNVAFVITLVNSGNAAFTNLTVSDNLGSYAFDSTSVTPLTYVANSLYYYTNGVLQPTPAVDAGPSLTITGITVPANGNATLIYETDINQNAPLSTGSRITNTVTVSGGSISTPLTADAAIAAQSAADLTITKSISPVPVTENGVVTYTFYIQNTGNAAATAADNVIIEDTFNPVLSNLTVHFNGTAWTEGANYTYTAGTGAFQTIAGQITVPTATFTQDSSTGAWITTPGVSVLTVSGTL